MKIERKITLTVLSLSTSVAALLFYFFHAEISKLTEAHIKENLDVSLNFTRDSINDFFSRRLREINRHTHDKNLADRTATSEKMNTLLSKIERQTPYFTEFHILDRNGNILYSSNSSPEISLSTKNKAHFVETVVTTLVSSNNTNKNINRNRKMIILHTEDDMNQPTSFSEESAKTARLGFGVFAKIRHPSSPRIDTLKIQKADEPWILYGKINSEKIGTILNRAVHTNKNGIKTILSDKNSQPVKFSSYIQSATQSDINILASIALDRNLKPKKTSSRINSKKIDGHQIFFAEANLESSAGNISLNWRLTSFYKSDPFVNSHPTIIIYGSFFILALILLTLTLGRVIAKAIKDPIDHIESVVTKLCRNDYGTKIDVSSNHLHHNILRYLEIIRETMKANQREITEINWYTKGQIDLSKEINGIKTVTKISETAIKSLCKSLDASFGIVYIKKRNGTIGITGTFGISDIKSIEQVDSSKNDTITKAIRTNITQVLESSHPENEGIDICSNHPEFRQTVIIPFSNSTGISGAIKIGTSQIVTDKQMKFLIHAMSTIETAIRSEKFNQAQRDLLAATQRQSKWLEIQQHELIEAKDNAESAVKSKSEFLATMSHEIRTPINGMLGMTDILKTTDMTEEQKECLDIILSSGDHLMLVINDILDFSQMDRNELVLKNSYFPVYDCIEEVRKIVKPMINKTTLDFSIDINTPLDEEIFTDFGRLRQILINLLSNAVKFTRKGSITLEVKQVGRSAGKTKYQFIVRDTGIGIPPEKQNLLYDAFTQVDSSHTREFGGTGLGLSICQKLSRQMDGSISLESQVEKGSIFTLEIQVPSKNTNQYSTSQISSDEYVAQEDSYAQIDRPDIKLAPCITTKTSDLSQRESNGTTESGSTEVVTMSVDSAHMLQQDPKDTPLRSKAGVARPGESAPPQKDEISNITSMKMQDNSQYKILIAEDNLINRKVVIGILNPAGYSVDIAENGQEAYTLATSNIYDIILMDMQMPIMGGIEAAEKILADIPPEHCPCIIAMTANAMASDRKRCLEAGMVDFMTKPIFRESTIKMIEKWREQRTKCQLSA